MLEEKMEAVPLSLKKDHDDFVQDQIQNRGIDDLDTIRPHRFSNCARAMYYDYHDPKDFSIAAKRRMWFGQVVHEWFQSFYEEKYGFEIEKEIHDSFKDKEILGHIDMVDNEGRPIDIKTTKSFRYIDDDAGYRAQLMAYMRKLGAEKGCLLYFHKGDGRLKEVEVQYDDDFICAALEKMSKIHNMIECNKKPEKTDKEYYCNTCRYKRTRCGK